MKKLVLVLVLAVVSVAAVSALDFYVTPGVGFDLALNNYFRGVTGSAQTFMDFGFLAVGLEAKADYDSYFNNFNIPILLLVGWRNFWLGAGYTFSVTSMNVGGYAWQYGAFPVPNVYALGANILRFPVSFGAILLQSEISYTLNGPVVSSGYAGFDALAGFLFGLKAYVGVGLELKL